MLPKGCVVREFSDVFSPAAVRAYRHHGFLVVERFLPAAATRALTAACNAAVRQRGSEIFPGMDEQHRLGATTKLHATMNPLPNPAAAATVAEGEAAASPLASSTNLGFGDVPLPSDLQAELETAERNRTVDSRVQKMHFTLKNQRAVDRAYRRLSAARARYNRYRRVRAHVTAEEEMAGDLSDERIRELQAKYTYEDFQSSFRHYRDSGLLEKEIRRDHHINDAMAFMQGWPRVWCWLWHTSPELRSMAASASGAVGKLVGEAAGHLAGEVVLRVYSDSVGEATWLSNAAPLSFTGAGTNFHHPHALGAQLQLELPTPTSGTEGGGGSPRADGGAAPAATVLIAGSHHVVRRVSLEGAEMDRFQTGGIFDVGAMVRALPEMHHLPVVELPALPPGAVLFFNNYLVMGTQANLHGAARDSSATAATSPVTHATNFTLSLIPDRCAFDGQRNSWASRDSHGPLYSYQRGQLLTDDAVFPVIHRAVDIE
ncbi:hypothetical protein NESM_000737200 [Novymonas esmeraldas]|uniref:Uncharacterized protein n=1 Tax=Novymonas esmeraldas TaxID=1808958 RepID=A0AAW0EYF5_9TRYP